jgi:glycyl-tRNA synthetase beta chain
MSDFLLELRSEEIPARMQVQAKADLTRLFEAELAKHGLKAASIEAFATPRRLALIARDLPDATEAVSEELKGPPADAPDAAVEGFLRKSGLTRDALEVREVKGRATFFAVIDKPGRATVEVLAEAIPAVVRAFPWPKSMRWGAASLSTESLRWVRPLQGIVALLGETIVPFSIDGIEAGAVTLGHRFVHPGPITIGSANDYVEKLRACHVIVHFSERCAIIRDGARDAAAAAGLTLVEDEGLVAENAGLTEWPVPLLGRFDDSYLSVPQEIIQLTARVNQKYFVCSDADGKLANAFVCTANIDAPDGGTAIVDGNRKVLAARLADAKFFWDHDVRVPLEQQAQKLSQIVFHEKLGTVADKVERVAKLARWLCEQGIVAGDADLAERAARLCKADLVTGTVGEFPELQGVIGGHLARAQGEDDAVADAIRDHYKPVGQGDDVPTAPVTVAVSLADKLDTIFGFFAIGQAPTGSKDPFALRRAAIGVSAIIEDGAIRLPVRRAYVSNYVDWLTELAREWANGKVIPMPEFEMELADPGSSAPRIQETLHFQVDQVYADQYWQLAAKRNPHAWSTVLEFLADRLKVQQREAGVRHDLIDAVFALGGEDDLVRLLARVRALQAFIETPEGTNLLAGYKRAANILKKESFAPAEQKSLSYTPLDQEKALIDALDAAEPQAAAAVESEDFDGAMRALAALRGPIDDFFEGVTVNDENPDKRAARLALLARFRDAVHRVADFSKIEG